jgi:DNA-binding NarL/FixJ family response regulator
MPLRILLADDHCIVRQGLRALLERSGFEVVGEAADGQQAITLTESLNPDVVVLDLTMPVLNGLDAGRQILQRKPAPALMLLTMHTEAHHVAAALRAGFRAYLLKTQAAEDLVRAIRDVVRGQIFLSSAVSRVVVDGYVSGAPAPCEALAPRERQVLQLVAEGNTSKEIAVRLGLSVKTVDSYRARVMEKLDVHETAGLVRYAIRHGVIEA